MGFVSLNGKTFEQISDPDIMAASRCLSILHACIPVSRTLQRMGGGENLQELFVEQLSQVTFALHQDGARMEQDLRALGRLLGCEIMAVPSRSEGGQN